MRYKEDVVIVAKTKMQSGICVGGVIITNGSLVRLLPPDDLNWSKEEAIFEIGEVWNIEFEDRKDNVPPHVEDIWVYKKERKYALTTKRLVDLLINELKVKIWEGSHKVLFDSKLQFENNKAYISQKGGVPQNSVGFWLPDKDLIKTQKYGRIRYDYMYNDQLILSIPFVGLQPPVDKIPKGTLVRVSLARWWDRDGILDGNRCYLQLSGWYKV